MSRLLCRIGWHAFRPSNVFPALATCARHCGAVDDVGQVLRLGR